jgi:hypothetical protein
MEVPRIRGWLTAGWFLDWLRDLTGFRNPYAGRAVLGCAEAGSPVCVTCLLLRVTTASVWSPLSRCPELVLDCLQGGDE